MTKPQGIVLPDPKFSDFNLDQAIRLLNLIDEAHQFFFAAQKGWNDWQSSNTALPSEEQEGYQRQVDWDEDYTLLTHLIDKRISPEPVGFIARGKGQRVNEAFIIFRGTLNVPEWINNVRLSQDETEGEQGVEIHRGFLRTYLNGGSDSLKFQVNEALRSLIGNPKIFVSGHSRGGALATVATFEIFKKFSSLSRNDLILYTFASPRVGDDDFVKEFNYDRCFRIANSEDLVPKLPLASLAIISLMDIPVIGDLFGMETSSIFGNIPFLGRQMMQQASDNNYKHVGQPIYFTAQRETIAKNHTIPVYKDALSIAKSGLE